MQKSVFFARHGRTPANFKQYLQSQKIDESLDETGQRQAANLGERVKNENIGLILTSTAKRTIETSLIVAGTIAPYPDSPSVIAEADFLEINCGLLDGLYYEEVQQKYPALYNAWWGQSSPFAKNKYPFPGGEGFYQITNRGKRAVERIKRACDVHPGNPMVISHGSIISVMIAILLGINPEVFFSITYFENCGLIKIDLNHLNSGQARLIIS